MDPNTALNEALDLAYTINMRDNDRTLVANADRLAALVIDLDHWISTGGFLPAGWTPAPTTGDCTRCHADYDLNERDPLWPDDGLCPPCRKIVFFGSEAMAVSDAQAMAVRHARLDATS